VGFVSQEGMDKFCDITVDRATLMSINSTKEIAASTINHSLTEGMKKGSQDCAEEVVQIATSTLMDNVPDIALGIATDSVFCGAMIGHGGTLMIHKLNILSMKKREP